MEPRARRKQASGQVDQPRGHAHGSFYRPLEESQGQGHPGSGAAAAEPQRGMSLWLYDSNIVFCAIAAAVLMTNWRGLIGWMFVV